MLITMVFLSQFKNSFNHNSIEQTKESELMKRKLNIKKGNISQNLYPSPFNDCLGIQKKSSWSIKEINILTMPSSKIARRYKNLNTVKLRSFYTAKKTNERYNFQSKGSFGSTSKNYNNRNKKIYLRNFSQKKLSNINSFSKRSYRIVNPKKSNSNLNNLGNNSQNLKTPMHSDKKTIQNDNKCLTVKLMKNKENLNINYLNNRIVINNYSCRKNGNVIYSKIGNKCNYIEPKNLFHNAALKNIGSDSKGKIF